MISDQDVLAELRSCSREVIAATERGLQAARDCLASIEKIEHLSKDEQAFHDLVACDIASQEWKLARERAFLETLG